MNVIYSTFWSSNFSNNRILADRALSNSITITIKLTFGKNNKAGKTTIHALCVL